VGDVDDIAADRLETILAADAKLAAVLRYFLIIGMALGKVARMAIDEAIGSEAGLGDRVGGAALGAVRVGLVATTFVLIFDQFVPISRQPAFLNGSQLRPLFSAAGQKGLRSLPPDATATFDRLKQEHRI
jgi:membrane protein required for colicin V production